MRGNITQQSLNGGGFNQGQTQTFNQQNDVQTTTVSINPYLERRFGGYGTGRLGYTYNRTLQDQQGNTGLTTNNQGLFGTPSTGTTGNLTTQQEQAFFNTGENFGRYNDQLTIQATQYAGVGSYAGAHRNEISNQVSYAIDRRFTLIGAFGYQDIKYGGMPPLIISQPSYDAGIRYAPSPDTSITVEYGKRDGQNNLSLDSQVALTARIRLIARYSTGITTDLEQSQSQLGNTTIGANNALVDRTTGAPVNSSGSYSGLQNGVYRLKRFSASVLYLQERDSYAVSINNEVRTSLSTTSTVIGGMVVPAGTNTSSTYGALTWQHDLSPVMNTTTTVQYGTTNNTGQFVGQTAGQSAGQPGADQTTLALSAALNRQFTQTLSGSVRYTFTDQSGGQIVTANGVNSGTFSSNTLLVSLRKSF